MLEKWFQRSFSFDIPETRFPMLIERLRGAPARAEEKLRAASPAALSARVDGTWSAIENIGHLTDLEELHFGRLDDLHNNATTLRAADLKNEKTWNAKHHLRPVELVLREFRIERTAFVARLEAWDPALLGRAAMHPRLRVPMRVIDIAHFVAEHDDAHLALTEELLRRGKV